MKLQPIVYTTDMDRAVAWYTTVLDTAAGYTSEVWTAIAMGDATLGIHRVETRPDDSYVELSIVATEPLEVVIARLQAAGVDIAEGIIEQPFGRSFLLRDPDGAPIQVNEHAH